MLRNIMSKRVVLEISEDLHTQLKLLCVRKKITITAEVTKLICQLLDGEAKTEKEAQEKTETTQENSQEDESQALEKYLRKMTGDRVFD